MDYPIPHHSRVAFESSKGRSGQNASLVFDRFAPNWSQDPKLKKEGLEATRQAAARADKTLLTAWQERWRLAAEAVGAVSFSLKTDWRLIAGLGRKGSLEVGFTFHRYGFPIIPGSSLKGLARAWAFFQIAEKLDVPSNLWPALEEALQLQGEVAEKQQQTALWELLKVAAGELPDQWRCIFGTQEQAGKAIFFDAIPATLPTLELDIMNPHYPDYYGGTAPPTDWQSPRPVYFLTVAPNTEFCFAVGWRGAKTDDALRQIAEGWLVAGLTELGAGAKTSAGYGYFQSEETKPTPESSPIATASTTPKPVAPPVWRSGIIVGSIDTSRTRRGKVEDVETKQVYEFPTSVIKGNTPGKKARVEFVLQDGKVVALRRKQ